eukprot:gene20160-39806_t
MFCQVSAAETVQVKYHGAVSLNAFVCSEVRESSDVSRICYDKAERYMVIQLKTTNYHYCEIDAATVQGLLQASSKREFFQSRIRGSGGGYRPRAAGHSWCRRSGQDRRLSWVSDAFKTAHIADGAGTT